MKFLLVLVHLGAAVVQLQLCSKNEANKNENEAKCTLQIAWHLLLFSLLL